MDIERTMEFILQTQAKNEAEMTRALERMSKAEARMDRADARMDRADARMEKFDRRLEGMRKLVETGMKWLVKIEKAQKALAEAQLKTDVKLDRLIDSWSRRPSNGHRPNA